MAQAAATALKFDDPIDLYEASTRQDALQSVLSGEAVTASHDHVVSPLVHNAANHLIKNKKQLDIEILGFPHEVLEQTTRQLEEAGLSTGLTHSLLEALEQYILNMGTDFSRAAQAKPLYARFKVTDHEPDDLLECEQSQATFLDGMKSYGAEAVEMIRYLSLFGSKSTSSQGQNMDNLWPGHMGLFIYFGSASMDAVKGFDSIDAAMMNAMQGMGGAMSDEAMAELKEMILNGELTPEALALIENLAELAQLKEAMLTPEAVDGAEAKLSELVQEISEQVARGVENGTLPPSLVTASISIMTDAIQNSSLNAVFDQTETQDLSADNDNGDVTAEIEALIEQLTELATIEGLDPQAVESITAQIEALKEALANDGADLSAVMAEIKTELSELAAQGNLPDSAYAQISDILPAVAEIAQTVEPPVSLLDQLPELATLGAEELLEVIQELSQTENLPPELQDILDQIDIDNLTPETLAEALSAKADSDLAQSVQALVVSLNTPEVQALLPQETLNQVSQFLNDHSALVEAVSTHTVVQNLETVLETINPDAPEAQEIKAIVEGLKDGTQTIQNIEPTTLQEIAIQLGGKEFAALQNAIETVDVAKAENVVLADQTVAALNEVVQSADLTPEVQEALQQALETGDQNAVLDLVTKHPEIIQQAPQSLQDSLQVAVETHAANQAAPIETSAPVALAADTIELIENISQVETLDVDVQTQIEQILANPQEVNPADLNKLVDALGDKAPTELTAMVTALQEGAPQTLPPMDPAVISEIQTLIESSETASIDPADTVTINDALAKLEAGGTLNTAEITTLQKLNTDFGEKSPVALSAAVQSMESSAPRTYTSPDGASPIPVVLVNNAIKVAQNVVTSGNNISTAVQTQINKIVSGPINAAPAALKQLVQGMGNKAPLQLVTAVKALQNGPVNAPNIKGMFAKVSPTIVKLNAQNVLRLPTTLTQKIGQAIQTAKAQVTNRAPSAPLAPTPANDRGAPAAPAKDNPPVSDLRGKETPTTPRDNPVVPDKSVNPAEVAPRANPFSSPDIPATQVKASDFAGAKVEIKSFKQNFNQASGVQEKATVVAQKLASTFMGCKTCTNCGACGTTANAVLSGVVQKLTGSTSTFFSNIMRASRNVTAPKTVPAPKQ